MKRTNKERGSSKHVVSALQKKMYKAPDTVSQNLEQSSPSLEMVSAVANSNSSMSAVDKTPSGVLNVYNLRSWWNSILAEPEENFESRASLY